MESLYLANILKFQGPIAVPAGKLDKILCIQTHVNGSLRQNATTEDLIFSIPTLIKTLSDGQTIQPGDVLATGTVRDFNHCVKFASANTSVACRCRYWKEASRLPSTER
jgi:2-keto-4-pentenoate hydratase/2-oxohepta-3-ene-1,7-dioic acid hydratase in catechol pathway